MMRNFIRFNRRIHVAISLSIAMLVAATVGCGSSSFPEPTVDASTVVAMRKADSLSAAGGAEGGGTGWGTIKGRFIYTGAAPTPGNIGGFDPAKDPLCNQGKPPKDETLLVDASNKGLANVLIFLTKASRVNPEIDAATPKEVVFDQNGCRFLSRITPLSVKSTLAVLNTDNTAHNTSVDPKSGNDPFNVLLALKTGRYDYKFKKPTPNAFEATCAVHPWMKAYIIARPDTYFAVTKADGSFEIPKLPAGEALEFQVWHERGAGEKQSLNAKPEWKNGRFKLTIPKDGETVDLQEIAVEPSALQ